MTEQTDVRWPNASDYSRAIQSPERTLQRAPLTGLSPVFGAMGMPMSASGQNAVVFLLEDSGSEQYALRCFTTPANSARSRYEALHSHVGSVERDWLAAAEWVADGVSVDGRTWPVVLMPWVSGTPLNVAVLDAIDDGISLDALIETWGTTVGQLGASGIAHGDLQHGNVLVRDASSVTLVDLDGVWLPQVGLTPPNEYGHPNYQHPQRTPEHWGKHVDSFSALVIDTSLRAMRAQPELAELSVGENLLFTREDFQRPEVSTTFDRLAGSPDPEAAFKAQRLRELSAAGIERSLVPFADLVARDGTTVVPTDSRAPVGKSLPTAIPGGDWWADPTAGGAPFPATTSASTGRPAATSAGSGAWWLGDSEPARVGTASASAGPSVAGRESTQASGSLGAFGRTSTGGGLLGGLIGGLVALLAYAAARGLIVADIQAGLFVLLAGPAVGFFSLATQDLLAGRAGRGIGRGTLGAVAGLAAAGAGLAIGNPIFRSIFTEDANVAVGDGRLIGVVGLLWAVVAGLIGAAIGALVSVRAACIGLVAGALGGLGGGVLFGASTSIENRTLVIDPANVATIVTALAVSALIGLAVGSSRRLGAHAVAKVTEGPSQGLEVLIKNDLTIGSGPRSGLRLDDGRVAAHHATVHLSERGLELEAFSAVRIDGVPFVQGRTPLASGAVMQVGSAFVAVTSREESE